MTIEKISLFDLDHTLLSTSCSFSFGAYLYKKGLFSTLTMLKLVGIYSLQRAGFLSLVGVHSQIFKRLFLGKKANLFKQHLQSFIEEEVPSILYPPAIEKLQEAKKNQHFIAILSNSPDFIVHAVALYLGIPDFKATTYAIDEEEKFSSISCFFQGVDKAGYLKNILKRFNLEKINVTAYSDSVLDLPFLQEAGFAVAVNPDRKLKKIATRKHWEII